MIEFDEIYSFSLYNIELDIFEGYIGLMCDFERLDPLSKIFNII